MRAVGRCVTMTTLDVKLGELLKFVRSSSQQPSWELLEAAVRDASRITVRHEQEVHDLDTKSILMQCRAVVVAALEAAACYADLVAINKSTGCGGACALEVSREIRLNLQR